MGNYEPMKSSKRFDKFIEVEGFLADELSFVARAVSSDMTRFFMMNISVEPSEAQDDRKDKTTPRLRAVATDGRRLHLIDPLHDAFANVYGMTVGSYKVVKLGKVTQIVRYEEAPGDFPKYRQLIPGADQPIIHRGQFIGIDLKRGRGFPELLSMFRMFPKATACNFNYLADLGYGKSWDVEWRDSNKVIVFKNGNRTALVMPMSTEAYD